MVTRLRGGPKVWEGERDEEGHRTYKVTFLVDAEPFDGPANVLQTPGLPVPGTFWLLDGDVDVYAHCKLNASVKPVLTDGEPGELWTAEFTFSTKPNKRCTDTQVEDPLLEPMKISGNWSKDKEEATADRFGKPVFNSAGEQVRGHPVEFDTHRPSVKVEMNVLLLGLELLAAMVNTVNSDWLWGLPPRTVKLANAPWERKYRGTCEVYFTRTLEFEVRYEGWDRDVLDEGTRCLRGYWRPPGDAATGTAQAGAATAITLASTASAVNDYYNGLNVTLTGGTGSGQSRQVVGYVGATKVATVDSAWGTNPDVTSTYRVDADTAPAYIVQPNIDRSKAGNYVRYKDPHGENGRTILDGAGAPFGIQATNDRYASLAGFNSGHAVTDATWWQKLTGPVAPPSWNGVTNYRAGNLVFVPDLAGAAAGSAGVYICTKDVAANLLVEPGGAGSSVYWRFLRPPTNTALADLLGAAGGPVAVAAVGERLPELGVWVAAAEYALGDLVQDGGSYHPPGRIHVEKYPESDFLLLGIPASLNF
jgi:hypothetical protein